MEKVILAQKPKRIVSFIRKNYTLENMLSERRFSFGNKDVESLHNNIHCYLGNDINNNLAWDNFKKIRFMKDGCFDDRRYGIDKLIGKNFVFSKDKYANDELKASSDEFLIMAMIPVMWNSLGENLDITKNMRFNIPLHKQALSARKFTGIQELLTTDNWWEKYRINDNTLEAILSLENTDTLAKYGFQLIAASSFMLEIMAEIIEKELIVTEKASKLLSCATITHSKGMEMVQKSKELSVLFGD